MTENNILSIRAKPKVKSSFYKLWEDFNNKRMGKVPQGEFLDYIVKIARENIPELKKKVSVKN